MAAKKTNGSKTWWIVLALATGSFSSTHAQESEPAQAREAQWFATVAEQSDYTETATDHQVEAALRNLASRWPQSELTSLGQTVEGRPLWALVVEPSTPTEWKPITVLMLGGIHSGECDGKEALLALAREMAAGRQGDWWHTLRLIFVPNFNADANQRRGPGHRPGQAGPTAGMGLRENAQGLDLNRDFIKLDSPEVRGLVAALNEYDVDVLIDTHTTNGSLHQYQLTYDIPHNPATPQAIDDWLRSNLIPAVNQRMADAGFATFYYGNFDTAHRRWTTYGHEPRYSTEYMGLRGKIGILSESYSYAGYQTRIDASFAFVREVLQVVANDQEGIRKRIDVAAKAVRPGQEIPLQGKLSKTADGVLVKGFQRDDGSPPQGPYSAESLAAHQPKDYSVQLWNRVVGQNPTTVPMAYAVPAQYAWALSRVVRHGIQVHQLDVDWTARCEVHRVEELEKMASFQRHRRNQIEISTREQQVELKKGSYIVETSQPLGVLASYLLEPEADDSLAAWNFLDPDLRVGRDYPVVRVLASVPEGVTSLLSGIPPAEKITLDRLMEPGRSVRYGGDSIRGARWLKGSSEYVVRRNGRTYVVDAQTGATRALSEVDSMRRKLASLEAFSDEQAAAAATMDAFTEDWAFALVSHRGDLYYFNSATDSVRQLTHSPDEKEQLAELSPTGEHVAFVRDNNLWVVDCESTELKQLTRDGSVERLNGILDWVYQEELYGRGNFKAFWWSPGGTQIAFLQLDQTQVPDYQVSDSISYGQSLEATRYPKAGQPLPDVHVGLVGIDSGETRHVDLSKFDAQDRLIARVTWSPDHQVWLQVFNRVQNRQDLVRVDPESMAARTLLTEVSPGWIEVRGTPRFLPDGDFLWLSDLPEGRTHLYRVSEQTGQRSQLTSGEWDVQSLVAVTPDPNTAFVLANSSHPTETQMLAVDLDTGAMRTVTSGPGTHRTQVDGSGRFFIDVFSSKDSQPFASLHAIGGEMLRVIEAQISDRHQFLDIVPPRSLTIEARDGLPLQAQIMLPPGIDLENPEHKLPVIFYVYGGPQAPTVKNSWSGRNYWWHQMLCQQGFAVVLCDNRSARGRGVKDTWTIRGDLCRVELQDLEDAVGWVKSQPWADEERFGLWGWSYGGYFTSYALTHSKSFRCGIAGAPVTDWRNYDAIYTERYMGLPQENEAGYRSSSSVESAANLHGELLIIHGERDDNVHMSNSLQLAYALQKAGKQFEMMIYPKNRHGIVAPDQRYHMYRMMTNFFHKHLTQAP